MATLATSVLSAAYVGICGRLLGPAEYSIIAALLALSSVTVLLNPAGDSIAKVAAEYVGRDDLASIAWLWRVSWKVTIGAAITVLLMGALTSGAVGAWLGIPSRAPTIALAAYLAASVLVTAPRAFQRGLHRFESFAVNQVSEAAVRLAAGAALAVMGYGAPGVLAGYALGTASASLLGRVTLNDVAQTSVPVDRPRTGRFAPHVSISFLFMSIYPLVLMNADVLTAKHVLTPEQAGLYGAASSLSRLAAVAVGPITIVLLSKVTTARAAGRPTEKLVFNAGMTILGLLLTALLGAALLGEWAVLLMYGEAFRGAAPILTLLVASVCLLVLQSSVCTVLVGLNKGRGMWLLLLPCIVQVTLLQIHHGDARAIAVSTLCAAATGLLALGGIFGLNRAAAHA